MQQMPLLPDFNLNSIGVYTMKMKTLVALIPCALLSTSVLATCPQLKNTTTIENVECETINPPFNWCANIPCNEHEGMGANGVSEREPGNKCTYVVDYNPNFSNKQIDYSAASASILHAGIAAHQNIFSDLDSTKPITTACSVHGKIDDSNTYRCKFSFYVHDNVDKK